MSTEETQPVVCRLPAQATSASEARGLVRRLLHDAGRDDLGDPAELLVSEMVTNALLHAGTPVDLRLSYEDGTLLAQVGDGTPHLPSMRRYGSRAGTGRGLRLLDQMADEWGVTARTGGKTVWFRLSVADKGIDSPADSGPGRSGKGENSLPPGQLDVELHNMPLLLHAAWQEFAETMLREFLLVTLDGDDNGASLQVHARAMAAIAVLEEHVPRANVAIEADQLMQDATEPLVSAWVVHLPVTLAVAQDFDILDRAIDRAIGLAGAGLLLTPPSQPEIQEFRRWVCAQVRQQAAGAAPEGWSMEREPAAGVYLRLNWDTTVVREASTGRIAADEANRIVAVSLAAAEMLGYAEPADLIGCRIAAIVPDRFRQAHVAGFTMFLHSGRRPLIDVPVAVPALCKDGSEVEIELLVKVHPAGPGKRVFVADLRPV
ncbi:MAG: ATP-binding protein [Marmoricola sp.]